jgi:rubrerythrin
VASTPTHEQVASPKLSVRCADCGYGAVVRALPEACPMCRGSRWEPDPRRDGRMAEAT